jgi:hypothetical protein
VRLADAGKVIGKRSSHLVSAGRKPPCLCHPGEAGGSMSVLFHSRTGAADDVGLAYCGRSVRPLRSTCAAGRVDEPGGLPRRRALLTLGNLSPFSSCAFDGTRRPVQCNLANEFPVWGSRRVSLSLDKRVDR